MKDDTIMINETMIDLKIMNALRTLNENECFVIDTLTEKKYTYCECFGTAKAVSNRLKDLGAEKVIVILDNSYPLFVMYFACMFANITIIPVDPQKSRYEIHDILSEHKDAVVIGNVHETETIDTYPIEEFYQENFVEKIALYYIWNDIDLEKIYMITYTSGSTGRAKGVRHSLKNLFWSAISFGTKMQYGENSILCHTMPMTYMAGILNTILMPFIMHAKIVIFPRFNVMSAVAFWRNVVKYNVNTFWLSPTMLRILLTVDRKGHTKEYFSDCNPVFSIGTAPLNPELKLEFENRYKVKLYQSYGLSETLFLTTASRNDKNSVDSVGKLLYEADIQVADDGEILIHVPWMFKGYHNKSEKDYLDGEYYISGDLGALRNGELFITGRKKDLIVRGGMNISPFKIEKELYQFEEIGECCVTGIMIDGEERTVCCYVAKDIECETLERKINSRLIVKLGVNYRIDCFKKVENIPKNLNGKIDKNNIKKIFL